jgi:hypothetical protein
MLELVLQHDYQRFINAYDFYYSHLRCHYAHDESVLPPLNTLMKTQRLVKKHLQEATSTEEYIAWLKSREVMDLAIMLEQVYRNTEANYKTNRYDMLLRECTKEAMYLLSEECVRSYA